MSTRQVQAADVLVIGGGIIGRSVASSAARRGMTVVVVEPGGGTFGTSSANAGHLVPSHVVPFAAPGMVRAGLHSLLARDGSFAIAPRSALGLAPWLWRFMRASTSSNVARGVPVLRYLLHSTVAELGRLQAAGALLDHSPGGILQVCSSQAGLKALHREADEWGDWGVRSELLDATELRAAEPMVNERALGAVRLVDDARFDPALLLAAVAAEGDRHGVESVVARVARIEARGDLRARVHTSVGVFDVRRVVVAAGVWTPALCRPLGVHLPIVAARGNSVTLPGVPAPHGPMLLHEQRLALSPLAQGLRLTTGFKLTSPTDRDVDSGRCAEAVRRAGEVLDLPAGTQSANEWTGLRPATPDGLPVIGPLLAAPSVLVAAGHGMLGSTSGPGTGEVVAAMLAGEPPPFDMSVVSPARFARKGSGR
ncbi:MAG: FAD-dependent oxidoreductase [Ilumatobacteraceae bacterium]